jgi:Putative zinc- or iron-chelating domain
MREFPIQQLIDDIARSTSPEEFDRVARHALDAFDALNGQIIEQRGVKLACREGCSTCCCLRVDVLAHEVFLIADHIRVHFTSEELEDLLARLAAHAELVLPMAPFEHATTNVVCPLLQNHRCSIYEVRPHACRRHHSQDFAACQYTFDHPADLDTPAAHDRELFRALTEAMHQNIDVYAQFGFDHTIYELGTALHEALHHPETRQHWQNREEAFIQASVTPVR